MSYGNSNSQIRAEGSSLAWRALKYAMNIEAQLENALKDLALFNERGTNVDESGGTGADNLRNSLVSILESIRQREEKEDQRLNDAAICAIEELSSISSSELGSYAGSILNSLKSYLNDPESTLLPNETVLPVVQIGRSEDLGECFCQEFMIDFVEQHSVLLERFEASVAGSDYLEPSGVEELDRKIKSYLHTLKGDSGTIGLTGIEKICHQLEDMLEEQSANEIADQLLNFRVWVESTAIAILNEREPDISSSKFSEYISSSQSAPESKVDQLNSSSREAAKTGTPKVIRSFVQVDTKKLDRLIETVGEMIISSSILIDGCSSKTTSSEALDRSCERVEKVSKEMGELATSLRLAPVSRLFNKMAKVVRETSARCGKEARLTTFGETTEIDRAIHELILDPLMHMVRNSISHGIETPEERKKSGKPTYGTVTLGAFQHGDLVKITVQDDGQGMDQKKIREKGEELGIIDPSDKVSRSDIFQLVFHPGFSTADQLNHIAGRGVGMEVVKNRIRSFRGNIKIDSVEREGTTFTIELPLTIGIVDGVIVRTANEQYVVPLASITEFLEISAAKPTEIIDGRKFLKVREDLVPVFDMADLLGLEETTETTEGIILLSNSGDALTAIRVDEIMGTCSTLLKKLNAVSEVNQSLSGATILSDGSTRLVVDLSILSDIALNKIRKTKNALTESSSPGSSEQRLF